MNQDKLSEGAIHSSTQQSLISSEIAAPHKKQEIYFWEKWALDPDSDQDDKCRFFEIKEDDISIHEVLREFESKTLGKKLSFSEVPVKKFPSVKRWINQIMASYPERRDETVEDLLNAFRYSLGSRSKERYKYIVGVLLLKDVLLLIHSKKDRSLAQWKENIHPVNLILHRKNVLRAAIIRNEFGRITFSAFEQSYSWSKGHAQFWGIEPENVGWDSLGSIMLSVTLPAFEYTIQLPVEPEQLDIMIKNSTISPTGSINIAKENGKITKVHAFRKVWEFNEFYDFCITEKEKLIEHRKEFNSLIPDGKYRSAYNYDSSFKINIDIKMILITSTNFILMVRNQFTQKSIRDISLHFQLKNILE